MNLSDAMLTGGGIVILLAAVSLWMRYMARVASDEYFKRKETHAARVRDLFKEEE